MLARTLVIQGRLENMIGNMLFMGEGKKMYPRDGINEFSSLTSFVFSGLIKERQKNRKDKYTNRINWS